MKNLQIQKMKQLNNYSFYLPFILSKLDIEVSNTDSNIIQLSYTFGNFLYYFWGLTY